MALEKEVGTSEYANALKDIYLCLHQDRKVTSQADFARKVDFSPIAASEMLRSMKPIPFRLLKHLYHTFNINVNYIISGGKNEKIYRGNLDGESMVNESDMPYGHKEERLLQEIDFLKKVIKDKEKIIELLEKSRP